MKAQAAGGMGTLVALALAAGVLYLLTRPPQTEPVENIQVTSR